MASTWRESVGFGAKVQAFRATYRVRRVKNFVLRTTGESYRDELCTPPVVLVTTNEARRVHTEGSKYSVFRTGCVVPRKSKCRQPMLQILRSFGPTASQFDP